MEPPDGLFVQLVFLIYLSETHQVFFGVFLLEATRDVLPAPYLFLNIVVLLFQLIE